MARHFKRVEKEVARASREASRTGSLKTVEEAVLGLDRRLQGLPMDPQLQVVAQKGREDFVPPGRGEYEKFLKGFMMGLSMWLLE